VNRFVPDIMNSGPKSIRFVPAATHDCGPEFTKRQYDKDSLSFSCAEVLQPV